MSEQLNLATFTGAHPTTEQLVEQLHAWGFRQLRVAGVHLVFRGPHGGTLRVLRSMQGRADATVAAKAARLAEVDEPTFWAGPEAHARSLARSADDTTLDTGVEPALSDEGRGTVVHDQIIALVLAVHVAMDQPLGFSQVAQLADVPLTRTQVSGASIRLCRDGQLVRIRSGVYQWAEGSFAARATPRSTRTRRTARTASPAPARVSTPPLAAATSPAATTANRPVAAELFEQLFPRGVTMTAEILADFERWAQLTEKLADAKVR